MKLPRSAWIGGGVLAFAAAVFVMVPPTKPLGGAKVDPRAHHGPADLPAPHPAPSVRPVAPAPSPDGFSGPAATVAAAADETGDETGDDAAPVVDAPAPPPRMADPHYANRDPVPVSAEEDRAFRAGNRWARERDIHDPRACRGLDDGPATDGCAAYARAARVRDEGDDDDSW